MELKIIYPSCLYTTSISSTCLTPSLLQAEFEKQASIISAEGDAIAAKMLSDAFDQVGDALIELRKMEAAEEIASNLAGSRNVTYLPKDNGMLLNLPGQ